jgi:hypothetical protein
VSEEINHPMYSTGIGLILKGYEKFENENISEVEKSNINKKKPFDSFLKKIGDFFEEKDMQM